MSNETAKSFLDDFGKREMPSVWPKVDKNALISGLRARVDNPNLVRQADTPLCGPASLVRTIAADSPYTYVRAAVDLYTQGWAHIREMRINPSRSVMQSDVLGNADPADWLMLASLRDSDNWFFSTAGWFGLNVAGITLPHEICNWFRKAGYSEIVTSTYLATVTKPIPVVVACEIQNASKYAASNYRVALFINADILDANDQDGISVLPNHWVVLASPIRDGGVANYEASVSFSVFTWGQIMNIPVSPFKPLSKRKFMDHYYGFVAARF